MTSPAKFPLWFTLLTASLAVMNLLLFGLFSLLHPTLPWPDAPEAAYFPIEFFAIRHIAFSVPLIIGLIRRDPKVLKVLYQIFLVIALLDVGTLLVKGYYIPLLVRVLGELSLGATVVLSDTMFIVPMALGLWHLSRYEDQRTQMVPAVS